MRRIGACGAMMLVFVFTASCGDNGDGGRPDQQTIDDGCQKLAQFCPTGYSWSEFGVTDEPSCKDTFECVYDFYSGDCRSQLVDVLSCLKNLTDDTGCSDCNDLAMAIQDSCEFPQACLE